MCWGCQNESNTHQLAGMGDKKIFHERDTQHVSKLGIKRFWAKKAKMIESNSHQLARIGEKNICHELDVHDVNKVGIKRFSAQDAKMSLTANTRSNRREENFSWSRRTSCLQSRNHLFLGSGCQNGSNSHELAPIGEKKIFHELDVHHVYKVGIICFWAQDAKMSLTANTTLESARREFSLTRRT